MAKANGTVGARRPLASRFVLAGVFGSMLPLVLVGLWLTRSTHRAGRELLRTQLVESSLNLTRLVDQLAYDRQGELGWLLTNDAIVRILAEDDQAEDRRYLSDLLDRLSGTIDSVVLRSASGDVKLARRPSSATTQGSTESIPRWCAAFDVTSRRESIGWLEACVRLHGLIPIDAAKPFPPGASLSLEDSSGSSIWQQHLGAMPGDREGSVADPEFTWPASASLEVIRHQIPGFPLRLEVRAPIDPFTRPFARSASTGILLLVVVSGVTIWVLMVAARRITSSLESLAEAAAAVAGGELDREVHVSTNDEVGDLAKAFNTMTSSLRQTLDELSRQRSLAAVGEFAASLSHEVRNNLTALKIDAQHATRLLPEDHGARQPVGRLADSIRRLDEAVSSALRLARGSKTEEAEFSLAQVLEDVNSTIVPYVETLGMHLIVRPFPTNLLLRGDRAALVQLLVNLLRNAAEASMAGGTVLMDAETKENILSISISDHGAGIPDPSQMFRLGVSTKSGGTGLGLSIARRIAEAHGGTLSLHPRASGGTVVRLGLPLNR